MSRCTVPKLLGFDAWFQGKFWDLCIAHDNAYMYQTGKNKADWSFCVEMTKRGYWWMALICMFFFQTWGWYLWLRRIVRKRK